MKRILLGIGFLTLSICTFGQIQVVTGKSLKVSGPEMKPQTLAVIADPLENGIPYKKGPSPYDSRIELSQLDKNFEWENKILKNARSVGIIVEKEQLFRVSETHYQVISEVSLKQRYNLCDSEPFTTQPSLGIGTAFLIDSITMCTAAHVFERPLKHYVIVFDYNFNSDQLSMDKLLPTEQVYELKDFVKKNSLIEYDIQLFSLKKSVNVKPLNLAQNFDFTKKNFVYAIGHPLGIPKKVSLNARILENKPSQAFFYTSLDAFQGNSGSPVFDLQSHAVIGILVSGEIDFEELGGCLRSTLCKPPFCDGEKIIKIDILTELSR